MRSCKQICRLGPGSSGGYNIGRWLYLLDRTLGGVSGYELYGMYRVGGDLMVREP